MKFSILLTFLFIQKTLAYQERTKRDANNSTLFYSYICDDEILLNIEEKFKVIVEENGNFHNKLKFLIEENENLQNKMKLVDKLVDENDNLRLKLDTLTTITSSINLHLTKLETAISNLTTAPKQVETNSNSSCTCDQMMDVLRNISDCKSSEKPEFSERNITDSKSSQQSDIKSILPPHTNCAEALQQNGYKSGIYKIFLPESKLEPFSVYCLADPEKPEAPWTVLQRRQDGSVDFYRTWVEYQIGFGNLDGEFFMGLEKLHALTQSTPHELWIQLEDFENATDSANYTRFGIGDISEAYALKILGSFKGNIGDSLSYHVGQKFTTKDVDNDSLYANNCAVLNTGAWWYNGCAYSNLNGQYLGDKIDFKGINWYYWHRNYQSLKYVHMAIRPVY